jgi:hypothetical protein
MLNFYYDPILGLRYNFLGEILLLDLSCIPAQEYDLKKWFELMKETGVCITEPTEPCVELVTLITEYRV